MSPPERRLKSILHTLTNSSATIGTLKFGGLTYDVPQSSTPSRLPLMKRRDMLDPQGAVNAAHLYFLFQKFLLGQDVFLISQPGPYARRLALTFCSLINSEYEYISLHRDVGETELKQGREIRSGGKLAYVDSAAVRAVKFGRILIIEGIEKAERGIMPVLNNLLENREMNLDDGTHIVHADRYALMGVGKDPTGKTFIPAHKLFRVIALGVPVPPYKGFPLDPPFRSRFQARFLDSVGPLVTLSKAPSLKFDASSASASISAPTSDSTSTTSLLSKLRNIILSVQYASELRNPLDNLARTTLPPFPQTSLQKLTQLFSLFPPPDDDDNDPLLPSHLARLILTIHPFLAHAPFEAWAQLSHQFEKNGLGALPAPASPPGLEDGSGYFGYRAVAITRADPQAQTAHVLFERPGGSPVLSVPVPAGPRALPPFPPKSSEGLVVSNRFFGLLTVFLQCHALGWDISYVPPVVPSTATCSTSLLVRTFAEVLGYEVDTVHLYKELGGREILMRRKIENEGGTSWEPSPLVQGAWAGRLVHLSSLDVIGPTAGSIARLLQDREIELWEGKRIVASASKEELSHDTLSTTHPSFRIIATASKSSPLKDWLDEEHANMFFTVPSLPMSPTEEYTLLAHTGAPPELITTLLNFAEKYRSMATSDAAHKNRKLGTRSLFRIARRLAMYPWDDDLYTILGRSLLVDFLPATERLSLDALFGECGIKEKTALYNPPPSPTDKGLLFFPEASDPYNKTKSVFIPRFDTTHDPEGVASHVPYMDHFYDNSLQTGLMRDIAIDLEVLKEHLVLLGNQGVGKNKIIDRICQLLGRPREYVQLHRDTTVNQLMFTTHLVDGNIRYIDSPLLRAIIYGRAIIIDEADKAPEHVVAIFRSLASQGELSLADGRRVRMDRQREDDVVVHPNFRMILLANRPGYPFLGNHFLQVLGDNFSCHSVSNPDVQSERRLLAQLAPDMNEDLIRRLVGAFQDLRKGYEEGSLSYPYSLRELINLIRHMRAYTNDSLETSLRNVFDFDVYRPETTETLFKILEHHGLKVERVGLDAVREDRKEIKEISFEPKGPKELNEPKFGKEDPKNEEHSGGNTWAGGTGGRDTAGLGGRGGYMRLFTGHNVKQVSDELKEKVPDHIREQARQMAREELARRLEELNLSKNEAKGYSHLLGAVDSHISRLLDLLENLEAKEEERVWVKRQTDGELDDSRLADGLTGEAAVYKRRGMAKPELGRPQIKPKRIRFLFDVSGSMYRFQYDGRLQRSLETAVMLMETFDRLSNKQKYVWDIYGHSGDGSSILLLEAGSTPDISERWKVVEKMEMISQYAFAGDYTVEAIEKAVTQVAKYDADDWFVIAVSDANFARYEITAAELKKSLYRDPKVKTALICIGEGAEATWIPKAFPGRGFRVANTHDIPNVLRSILSDMIS
ncbi:AAA domain-containing protein [Hysterangium stoloniferum]|nr:AAA domain-containing protein [Hysterangium stoloniferum]